MGINQRVSLRKFVDDVKRWVDEGRSDDWIASALGTSSSSVQSFRSRNGIYRKNPGAALAEPVDYGAYEGVIEYGESPHGALGAWFDPAVADDLRWQRHWSRIVKVEVRLSPTKIVIVGRGRRVPANGTGNGGPRV
ncbi:MAG: hypothetical protein AVDCRST_MAG78-1467 [uncultured Rubrobacteraceae bacterium]|uniref:Uncharacterized protein n=1 Tax=uncultured Rubrobacteraceae bacterium TaxID=349277 RepID=A0A6J4PZR2_9ACTN|nr:MAG: hypothetical protein AVDCRST_MAG78-1467 [uncultured Rubrobacteraceae bacterium]